LALHPAASEVKGLLKPALAEADAEHLNSILFLTIQVLYILVGVYAFNEYMIGEEEGNQ